MWSCAWGGATNKKQEQKTKMTSPGFMFLSPKGERNMKGNSARFISEGQPPPMATPVARSSPITGTRHWSGAPQQLFAYMR